MKFSTPIPVLEIAKMINAQLIGNDQLEATGINEIHKVTPGDVTFVDFAKYYQKSIQSEASIIIIDQKSACPEGKALLVCEKPFEAYEKLVQLHRPFLPWTGAERTNTEIAPSAIIEPGVMVGSHVKIGARTYIQAGVVIRDYVEIGEDVVIQSGAILGTSAFYLKKWPKGYQPWTSCGRVIIEDKVQIGAGSTINSGVSGDTIIGEGTKLDCQVQIGHGVVVGKHCLFASQVGIAGKTKVGDWCTFYGQVGVAQNLVIGNHVTILAKSGLGENIADGETYFGIPAKRAKDEMKEKMVLRFLTKSWERVRQLI